MADHTTPDDEIPQDVDAAQHDHIRSALGDLTFLDPATDPGPDVMPGAVWEVLQAALSRESAVRQSEDVESATSAAAGRENVVAFPVAGSPSEQSSPRRYRWVGGLVAASVAVVAVGLGVNVMSTTTPEIVAGSAATTPATASGATVSDAAGGAGSAEAFSAAPEASAASDLTTLPGPGAAEDGSVPLAATPPAPAAQAKTTPAARMVMASKTDYTPDQLKGQVVSLVKNAGFATPLEAMTKEVPEPAMPVAGGFTASWAALRDCLTWLTKSADTQALVVDRATYAGADAGVVVAPAMAVDADPSTPAPTVTLDTRYGQYDVWVVNPECKQTWNVLDDFSLYEWRQP